MKISHKNKVETIESTKVKVNKKKKVKKIKDVSHIFKILSFVGPISFKLISSSSLILKIFEHAGDVSKFIIWQKTNFGFAKIYRSKNSHFKNIILKAIKTEKVFIVYEFGVAHGYTTHFFLKMEKKLGTYILEYNGFDTFEGLPSKYRSFNKGSFSNFGLYPDIHNNKLFWHKGLVESTVCKKTFSKNPKIVIFDLDLFSPTLHVFKCLLPNLISGDILYFDEAFDCGEFSIIINELLPRYDVQSLGTSGQSIAFLILNRKS